MKKFLSLLAFVVAGIGFWGGYTLWYRQPRSAEFYVDKVNLSLRNNEPQQAFDFVNQGIALYPLRLDLRFGKVYMCQMLADYRCMRDEIIKLIDYSGNSGQKWKWLKNEDKDTLFMLGVLQNYQRVLWEAGQNAEVKDIADKILEYYPDHVESLNMVAVCYLQKGDWKNAEPYLSNALKLAPDDVIVQKNLQVLNEMKNSR